MEAETKAFAKINLHLEILNKRDDGYHNIFGLFANIGIFDLLKLEDFDITDDLSKSPDLSVEVRGGSFGKYAEGIPVERNLIVRAAKAYFRKINKSGRAVFSLVKNIPAGAGLGGGSADSAAALKLLSGRAVRLNDSELIEIGTNIGADVPFCITGGYGLCEGIGEKIEKIPGKLSCHVLLVNNGIHIETGKAYDLLQRQAGNDSAISENKKNGLREFIRSGSIFSVKNMLKNDFEEKVFDLYPELGIIKNRLYDFGAVFSLMSGSGSTLFGLFDNYEDARTALNIFRKEYKMVLLTDFL